MGLGVLRPQASRNWGLRRGPILPPEDTTSARPGVRNWTGGAWSVGRKGCWGGAADSGVPGTGTELPAEQPVGGGAGWPPARCPLSPPQLLAPGRRHRVHIVPPLHPALPAQSPIHLPHASALRDPEPKSGRAWVCVCPGSAGGAGVREALGGCWRGGPSSRGPRRCGSGYI